MARKRQPKRKANRSFDYNGSTYERPRDWKKQLADENINRELAPRALDDNFYITVSLGALGYYGLFSEQTSTHRAIIHADALDMAREFHARQCSKNCAHEIVLKPSFDAVPKRGQRS